MSPSGTCDVNPGSPSALSDPATFALESIGAIWDEALPLVRDNHRETGALSAEYFAPALARYQALEKAGALRVYTARAEGKLVGYATFILVLSHLHYPTLSFEFQDALYVRPDSRGILAIRFIRWQDQDLKATGVGASYRHNGCRKDYGRVLERLGYRPEEQRYVRFGHVFPRCFVGEVTGLGYR